MTTTVEYALMAGAAYISTRDPKNQFPIPIGWGTTKPETDSGGSGFEAVSFVRSGTTLATSSEIVISYAGTDPGDLFGDVAADLALAAGYLSNQLRQAADYYLQIKAANPGASISFTGHSLGGGLASLMAVLFGESGTTFDQAPFLKAAQTIIVADPQTGVVRAYCAAQELRDYLAGHVSTAALTKLDAYIAANALGNAQPNPADTLAGRSVLVSNTNTQGEFLTAWYLVPSSNRIGLATQTEIPNSNNVSGLDLHSQALLTAFLQSNSTATNGQTLNAATLALPDLLKLIFNKQLYAFKPDTTNTTDPNFLELIVNHEAGRNPRTGASITADAMVTHFTKDLWKLGTHIAGLNDAAQKALIAQGIEWYYWQGTDYAGQEFFTQTGSVLHYEVVPTSALPNKTSKATLWVNLWLDGFMPQTAVQLSGLVRSRVGAGQYAQWNVNCSAVGAIVEAANAGKSQILLGNTGADTLIGGGQSDALLGGAGADILAGGGGDDQLVGGDGFDSYGFSGRFDRDTLIDSDGNGQIVIDGTALNGGKRQSATVWRSDDDKYEFHFAGNLASGGRGMPTIQNWRNGQLGIHLAGIAELPAHRAVGNLAPLLDANGVFQFETSSTGTYNPFCR